MKLTKSNIISIIGIQGLPAGYGGFETLAENICFHLHKKFDFNVYCSSIKINKKNLKTKYRYKRIFLPIKANGFFSILYDYISIIHAAFNSDKLLILGVSGATILPIIKLLKKKIIIITNIDGIEWKREKWNKIISIFLRISEEFALRYSDYIVADNKGIVEHIKHNYKFRKKVNIKLISYGGDHMDYESKKKTINIKDQRNKFIKLKSKSYYLSICRIEPENNVDKILDSFKGSNQLLLFIGNWENNDYGKKLLKIYRSHENIIMAKPIYNVKEISNIRFNSLCYIHGHSAGGTNPSLVESLFYKLPIFAYDVNFNRYTLFNKNLYWKDTKELKKLIKNKQYKSIKNISNDYHDLISRTYKWEKITKKYAFLFSRY